MLISLNWIRDYVDLPNDLDVKALAERFTVTTAEVESVRVISIDARGLIAARIVDATELSGTQNLRHVVLDVGGGRTVESVTAAPAVHVGCGVVYAPPGASVGAIGEIGHATVAGKRSDGMILPGDALGVVMAAQEAIFLDESVEPGTELEPSLFDDWLLEIDNKSITHRPDLWGHFGVAREIAAIYDLPLARLPVADAGELASSDLPEIPISIADSDAGPRYSCIALTGVPTQPAPLWIQLRLGHVGMRPISALVDLTNYIMADLGQPMHAFNYGKVDRIEVDWAESGEVFRTLDGVDRNLTERTLMIKCGGRSIAVAGIIGGLETEVSETTASLLLESANFNAPTIRRAAAALSLRTDASARFEKSLDPVNTVVAIQRFIHLARPAYPNMKLVSRLSDCYPIPAAPVSVDVSPKHVARTIGRDVPKGEMTRILAPLGFEVTGDDTGLHVRVPTHRAAGDVRIEADVIEEIARCIGYDSVEPVMPRATVRKLELNAQHELEQRTIEYFTSVQRFNEIHGYLWYDTAWLDQLGFAPGACIQLRNPAAEGLERMRQTLMPGLLAALVKNRFQFTRCSIIELGSVFDHHPDGDGEFRHVGLIHACRGKRKEDDLLSGLKSAIEGWCWQRFALPVRFTKTVADAGRPWEHPIRTAGIEIDGRGVGRISEINPAARRAMDEHLAAWSAVWAEIRLNDLSALQHLAESLGEIPAHPLVDLDFSLVVAKATPYADVVSKLETFPHDLLMRISFIGAYEGGALGDDQRSLTFRIVIGATDRTLVDAEANSFKSAFIEYVCGCGFEIRG